MKYRFFSRKTGYQEAHIIKYFHSTTIDDPTNSSNVLIGLSSTEIIERLSWDYNIPRYIGRRILTAIRGYSGWYYYPADTQITAQYSEEF